ncbi:MAG: hypothetical protein V4793_15555, partial [Paraburkholderia tropica]
LTPSAANRRNRLNRLEIAEPESDSANKKMACRKARHFLWKAQKSAPLSALLQPEISRITDA